jgi:surface protein
MKVDIVIIAIGTILLGICANVQALSVAQHSSLMTERGLGKLKKCLKAKWKLMKEKKKLKKMICPYEWLNDKTIRVAFSDYLGSNATAKENVIAKFGPIEKWCTHNVKKMDALFAGKASFNENIADWDTSNVKDMFRTFSGAKSFNQNIADWDTSRVTTMFSMFYEATSFDQNIGRWNTSNVMDMNYMVRYLLSCAVFIVEVAQIIGILSCLKHGHAVSGCHVF